jgi:PHD/YefM family antitoxin component YafN of YafNO toxin-antitoxin module
MASHATWETIMSRVILDDALRAKLDLNNGPTELCDPDGKRVAVVLSAEEYKRLLYDLAWAEFSTPQAEAEAQAALEEVRQGKYVTSEQLFEELRQLGYMPRDGR